MRRRGFRGSVVIQPPSRETRSYARRSIRIARCRCALALSVIDTREKAPAGAGRVSPSLSVFPEASFFPVPCPSQTALEKGSISEAAWGDYKMLANVGQS